MDRVIVIAEPLIMLASMCLLFGGAMIIDKIRNKKGNK